MVQFRILSGKKAGSSWAARRFPVRIGRSPSSDLHAEEDGVWDEHLSIEFHPADGFLLQSHTETAVLLNGSPVSESVLRNGDVIELGALKLQFWLADARQRGLSLREALIWSVLVGVTVTELALVYWLPK
jgi:pSer/pThr/pTyr-binding forkhead associated (FHA) protein